MIGRPGLGVVAAAEAGLRLERLALVPRPGADLLAVTSALLDGLDVVAVAGAERAGIRAADRQRLAARARQRGAVLVSLGPWSGADLELSCADAGWHGLGPGSSGGCGRLRFRRVRVHVRGRGVAPAGSALGCCCPRPTAGSRTRPGPRRGREAGSAAEGRVRRNRPCGWRDAGHRRARPSHRLGAERHMWPERRTGDHAELSRAAECGAGGNAVSPGRCGCWRCGRRTGRSPRPPAPRMSRRTGRRRCSPPTGCWPARRWPGRTGSGVGCAAGRPRPGARSWPCSPPTPTGTRVRSSRWWSRSRSWRPGWRSSGPVWWCCRPEGPRATSAVSWPPPSGWWTRSRRTPGWNARWGWPTGCSRPCSRPVAGWPSRRGTRRPSWPRSGWRSWIGNPASTGPSWSGCSAGSGCAASARSARSIRRTWPRGSGPTPCSATGWPAAWTRGPRCAAARRRS